MAAVGAMIASDSATASAKRSSRRRSLPAMVVVSPVVPVFVLMLGIAQLVKMSSGRNAPTIQFGASTTSWMRRSAATEHSA